MILTFGKYKGQDTRQLARTEEGRDYLMWCVDNLSNYKWRAECKKALRRTNTPYKTLEQALLGLGAHLSQVNTLLEKWHERTLDFEKHVSDKNREAVKLAFSEYSIGTAEQEIDPDSIDPEGHDTRW